MDQLLAMRSFVRVANILSFQEAAKLEGLSQGTISKRVSALEKHLGIQLLRRNQRAVRLTNFGESYLAKCEQLLAQFESVEESIKAEASSPSGIIKITLSPVLSRLIVAPLLVEFSLQYPKIEIVSFLTEDHRDIVGEDIDIAFRARKLEDSSLIAKLISSNPFTLAAAPSYLAKSEELDIPEHLENHNCLSFSRSNTPLTWSFHRGRKKRDIQVNGSLSADQGDILVQYAVAGAGIVLMPGWVMEDHLAQGSLVRLLPEWTPSNIPLYIVHSDNVSVPIRVRLLSDFIYRNIRKRHLLPR